MLYVFGDSFCHNINYMAESNKDRKKYKVYPPFIPLEDNWLNIVSKKLIGSTDYVDCALAGCSNEYIYHRLMLQLPNIKPGDQVIVSLTAPDRRWLVEECPHLSNWASHEFQPDFPGGVSKAQHNAITHYAKHLYSASGARSIYTAILNGTMYNAQQMSYNEIKFLILPGFDPLFHVKGVLMDISDQEFDSTVDRNEYMKRTNDVRWKHLTQANHTVLANKVIDFFEDTNHAIDLTTDFEKGIYTKDTI
jgi:hypothetical protein